MAVLVFAENYEGKYKKSVFEAVYFAHRIAKSLNTETIALTFGEADHASLGNYGADKVWAIQDELYSGFDAAVYSCALASAVEKAGARVVVLSHNPSGKAIAPRLAARLKAGLVSGVVDYPDTSNGFLVKRSVFSGKAFAWYEIRTDVKILALTPNAVGFEETGGTAAVESFDPGVDAGMKKVKVREVKKVSGKVPLSEAEIVVSGGRGLKGPENWGMIEELADLLGAATACSRPVADAGWRPHYEHVGQTGGTIRPNLYLAIGISGAIQHLAGVNQSKVIAVINIDPEAPFFKAADYGIVGDAFEVVPKLIEAAKAMKSGQ